MEKSSRKIAVLGLSLLVLVLTWVGDVEAARRKKKKAVKSVPAQPTASFSALRKKINTWANGPILRNGSFGFVFQERTSGKTLISVQPNTLFVPASTQKLITTYAALGLVGPDYRYKTRLEHDGTIDADGVLQGNLYITGSGDPTLGSERYPGNPGYKQLMGRWADTLKKMGIRRINGRVIGVSAVFDDNMVPDDWQWTDIGNAYGAGACGLNINENGFKAYFAEGKRGEKLRLSRTEPALPDVYWEIRARYGHAGTGDDSRIYGAPYASERMISGAISCCRADFPVKGSLPDPPLTAAQLLTDSLQAKGVGVNTAPSNSRLLSRTDFRWPIQYKTLLTHLSPPLKDVVAQTNMRSINMHAEALLNTIGLHAKGQGTREVAIPLVREYLARKGLDTACLEMLDGSGLSPTNLVSPYLLAEILRKVGNESFATIYDSSLAVAGKAGTIRDMGNKTAAEGNVRAKSGTLKRVLCFAGYVRTKENKDYIFVMMANRYGTSYKNMRRMMEELMVDMASVERD